MKSAAKWLGIAVGAALWLLAMLNARYVLETDFDAASVREEEEKVKERVARKCNLTDGVWLGLTFAWKDHRACYQMTPQEAQRMLRGSHVRVCGDSLSRRFSHSLASLDRHQSGDVDVQEIGQEGGGHNQWFFRGAHFNISWHWAPLISDLPDCLSAPSALSGRCVAVLWYGLHDVVKRKGLWRKDWDKVWPALDSSTCSLFYIVHPASADGRANAAMPEFQRYVLPELAKRPHIHPVDLWSVSEGREVNKHHDDTVNHYTATTRLQFVQFFLNAFRDSL